MMAVNDDGYVVIGAGLPRTGTNSLRLALSQVLNGPCYHMYAVVQESKGTIDADFWNKAIRRQVSSQVNKT